MTMWDDLWDGIEWNRVTTIPFITERIYKIKVEGDSLKVKAEKWDKLIESLSNGIIDKDDLVDLEYGPEELQTSEKNGGKNMKDIVCPKCGPTKNSILFFVEKEDNTVLAQCLFCGFEEVRSSDVTQEIE